MHKAEDGKNPEENKCKELRLLPHLLPSKLGNALLLQYFIHQQDRDKLGLLPLGFTVGIVSLAITLHASAMGFIFKSFNVLFTYNPNRVHHVRKCAHYINNILCLIQVLLVVAIFGVCVYYYDKKNFDDDGDDFFIVRRIYMLSFVVSAMLFGCAIVAVLMVLFLYCLHNQLARTVIATKITSARLPPPSNYVIDIGLANVLLALYIGINEDMVGANVMLHDLALWVGVLTMCMVMLDTIMTLALYIALSDGKLQLGEYTFLQIMHFFRYMMSFAQVVMFMVMLVQSYYILGQGSLREEDSAFKCPDNLLVVSTVLSSFVVGGALYATIDLIYLTRK